MLGGWGSCKEVRFLNIRIRFRSTWRCPVEHLSPTVVSPVEAKASIVPELPDLSQTDQTDHTPYNDTEIPEQLPPAKPEQPPAASAPSTEHCYP